MKNPNESAWIRKVYRKGLREELKRHPIQEEKRMFLAEHFQPAPVFSWARAVGVPALCFMTALIGLYIVNPGILNRTVPSPQIAGEEPSHAPVLAQPEAQRVDDGVPVHVKRATSRVGSVMVYQKTYQDTPMAIVWVFTPLEAAAVAP